MKLPITSLFFIIILCCFSSAFAQIVRIEPAGAGPDDAATLIFDASMGDAGLQNADKIYAHHGVVTDSPTGTSWNYVIGNWGEDDGIGEMTRVEGTDTEWKLEMTPSIRAYFGVPENESVFRISAVFRSADGNTKGTTSPGEYGWGSVAANLDFYINLNVENFLTVTSPATNESFLEAGEGITFTFATSGTASDLQLLIDEGNGFELKEQASEQSNLSYQYFPQQSGSVRVKYVATVNGELLETERTHLITLIQPTQIKNMPADVVPGINYDPADPTKATLVLEAPLKQFVYVVGDFTDWETRDDYQMYRSPDGIHFWLDIDGLTPGQKYVYQYWIDGELKLADSYAREVADPWNDAFIEETTFSGLTGYDRQDYGIASVLQTAQPAYEWASTEQDWQRPDLEHLVIYELLVRDFIANHDWKTLTDTLSYIKNLGVDAIEIMPFNEFEGNESWGYNPSFFFAVDKYYGSAADLKKFIETAHQQGLAVIMDIVLNHAYGQNPMVQMYFDRTSGKPAANNPWFNREYVGQYQWGYDFNHESSLTQTFVDRVNAYWIEEFHIDGYRFDFTKGFTNYAPGGSVDGFDQSRIDIMKRMADEIWKVDAEAYIILEHWAPFQEEKILADYGMKMWRNRSYDYVPAVTGNGSGSFRDMGATSHVSYFNSHDEQRLAYHALTEGLSEGSYDVKNHQVMYERMKMAAAFGFLFPGPKMLWQFDELGYDIDINFNGRVGNKPLAWGAGSLEYYEDSLRQFIYDAYQGILEVRKAVTPEAMLSATTQHKLDGAARRLSYNTPDIDLVVLGNFGLTSETINASFTEPGYWYDYFSGDSIQVGNPFVNRELQPGEWHIYTNKKLSDGKPGVVAVFDNPVTISPMPFGKNDQITIRFDAKKAFPGNTDGLVGAEKVYMHAGVVLNDPASNDLSNIVGTLTDDGIGEMQLVGDDIWEITITSAQYFSLSENDTPYKIGMYFRDANNENLGYGFRNSVIYFNVTSDAPFVTIDPPSFSADESITVTFNANQGNRELADASKVYMHSSVDLMDTETPQNTAWQYVTGNWGQDDGVGQMSPVPDQPGYWQITLTPEDYYGLPPNSDIYWLAAVFRNADGSRKGTGSPGNLDNGFIHTNQDFFIRNSTSVSTSEIDVELPVLQIFPNPATHRVQIAMESVSGNVDISLSDQLGRTIFRRQLNTGSQPNMQNIALPLDGLPSGMYIVTVSSSDWLISRELVVQR